MQLSPSLPSGSGTIAIEDDASDNSYVYAYHCSTCSVVVTHSTTLFHYSYEYVFLDLTPLRSFYTSKNAVRTINDLTRTLFTNMEMALCSVSGHKRAHSIILCGEAKPPLEERRYQELTRMRMWLTLYINIYIANICVTMYLGLPQLMHVMHRPLFNATTSSCTPYIYIHMCIYTDAVAAICNVWHMGEHPVDAYIADKVATALGTAWNDLRHNSDVCVLYRYNLLTYVCLSLVITSRYELELTLFKYIRRWPRTWLYSVVWIQPSISYSRTWCG